MRANLNSKFLPHPIKVLKTSCKDHYLYHFALTMGMFGSNSALPLWQVPHHMGAEPKNSFKGVPRDPPYGKLTTRHHRLRDYVSPNQTCKVFRDFGPKS